MSSIGFGIRASTYMSHLNHRLPTAAFEDLGSGGAASYFGLRRMFSYLTFGHIDDVRFDPITHLKFRGSFGYQLGDSDFVLSRISIYIERLEEGIKQRRGYLEHRKERDRQLKETPSWAVALVCLVMVVISMLMEHGIHKLDSQHHKHHNKAMSEALEKIKAELMLLGFISLLLTLGQDQISKICIPAKAGNVMLPCKQSDNCCHDDNNNRRKLLSCDDEGHWRRVLAEAVIDHCSKYNDKVPLISKKGMHQLHIFIFVVAIFHVLYSVLTMALGKAKIKKWKAWEAETASLKYQFTNDPARFRFSHQTSFVKRHFGMSSTPGIRWILAYFRQFFASVTKVDYLTMCHGFINAHLSPNSKFDFHKYIKRSLEYDFKIIVGISFTEWLMAINMMLLDVYKCYVLVWISFVPLTVLLLVGMKLEIIIMEMAHQIQNKTTVIKGALVVEPSNSYFWFNNPKWILFLIQLTLFQNAFQVAHFLWIWYPFGLKYCFHGNLPISIAKIAMGIGLQIMCSYITFPIYALVTQVGSHMKKTIFEEQTVKALLKWRETARRRKKLKGTRSDVPSGYARGENTPSRGSSSVHLLHKYKSSSADAESSSNSPKVLPLR
ncbi:LOW QUALITY PROTEIN: MLO protein homolog 1-like [Asparagus officinalis]|uniref:LOW QUALITY PROTEIN: MLO protein homolog 1-like n=1 Tax=Asparagus officinalis TaxID=4686 RepID=UPI00098E0F30|nr:LOW QUALITY PROTEIN: MLO protein homolog 1-like [Asparagus officinalis]